MSNYLYFPVVKTRDAELRCFDHVVKEDFENILPIYELTKSRRTSKAPDGDIYRRMKQIESIQKGRPFILDLSTNDKYINPQIEQLLSESGGFAEWQYFLFDSHRNLNIIPMIHLYEGKDGSFDDVEEFVKFSSSKVDFLAVRLPYDLCEEEYGVYLSPIVNNLSSSCKLYVILDAGFIRGSQFEVVVEKFRNACLGASHYLDVIEGIVLVSTSFPSNVANEGGGDSDGEFEIYEELVFGRVSSELDESIRSIVKYGDYASINTEQIEIKGGTFVPRIDIASEDGNRFTYKRWRRNAGGYVECAKHTLRDPSYRNLGTWADGEISAAAKGTPSGISPAFWISVRMNYYIKTRLILRS